MSPALKASGCVVTSGSVNVGSGSVKRQRANLVQLTCLLCIILGF